MRDVTVEQALAHPTWRMGPKVTIDSATLMNKGLEVIEAHWLFDMPYDKIAVVVQPQSIIHSMVEFIDDSIKMQASIPSMRLPIQYALSYPDRLDRDGTALAQPLRWPRDRTARLRGGRPGALPLPAPGLRGGARGRLGARRAGRRRRDSGGHCS